MGESELSEDDVFQFVHIKLWIVADGVSGHCVKDIFWPKDMLAFHYCCCWFKFIKKKKGNKKIGSLPKAHRNMVSAAATVLALS